MSNSTTETETSHAKIDMLHGSIWNKLPRYALPVAATAILEQLFNASDIAVVGNFSAGDKTVAVAAVGANSPIIGLILNLFIGIALGANIVIANAIGRKDMESVHKAVHTSIVMAVLGGIIVTLLGELIAGNAHAGDLKLLDLFQISAPFCFFRPFPYAACCTCW